MPRAAVSARRNKATRALVLTVANYVEAFYEGNRTKRSRGVSPEVRKNGCWRASPNPVAPR
jgi:hypothetical protein